MIAILSLGTRGQSISPNITTEMCPNTEITFSAECTGEYDDISSNWAQITLKPTDYDYNSQTNISTFTFKAKFSDNNEAQTFTITPKSGSPTVFTFKKIKSLFHYNTSVSCTQLQPNLSQISAPKCVISTFHLTFSKVKYYTEFESPSSCFGEITKYAYLLPANWKLDATTSDGSTVIIAGNDVTITSDVSTGGMVSVRPSTKDCPNATNNTYPFISIPISRSDPTFTISPASTQIQCTSTAPETFTVQTTGTVVCSLSYNWDLGANNHWKYNGSAAPASFSTTTNSITLTPAC